MKRILTLLLLFCLPAMAETILGKCIKVSDGDTITISTGNDEERIIRLYGIDAPELKQEFGQESKKAASKLMFNKDVTLDVQDTDKYGRLVAKVYVGKTYVNLELIKQGMAWWYQWFAPKETDLKNAELKAKEAKIGLWKEDDPTPPWVYKREHKRQPENHTKSQEFSR